ncbi:peptidase M14 [Luteimonas weifangensis]|uniref:Peptidase M14 n=2 Tax=Cognatiluteimonas weifangensis TaxID=2303539 RepID=A0A372DGN4_9GAMM|nr:M14 family metallopeptidase [Luteimonas weifangensis]RFP58044.1 peptidase M14 [Luteimonas weifangensis]
MLRSCLLAGLLAGLSALAPTAAASQADLSTVAERSGFLRTGRYAEVIALCDAYARAYPDAVRCASFGTTPEGRPMQYLVVTRSGAFTPQAAAARGLPVLLVQGGIHAGEIDGKDAGFLALKQALDGLAAPGALERQVLLFVPVFNVDGHERFGAWNRPNQRGPEQMGWRVTAQNYNLNRDYMKADAPEMQAMLQLVQAWDPLAYIDLHVTDGAKFRHDVSIQVEPLHAGDSVLAADGRALRDGVIARLNAQGSMALPFYPSFVEFDDPASGFEDGVSPPRFSNGYFWQRNRFGMLVETHSWKDYPTRVRVTRNTIVALLELLREHGAQWRADATAADARAARLAGTPVPLDWKATDAVRTIAFEGYAYSRTPSEISGALMTRYDESVPQTWQVPLRDALVPNHVAVAPGAGYLVPAAWAPMVEPKLQLHGIAYRRLDQPLAPAPVQAFRAEAIAFGKQSFEGHQRLEVTGAWAPETQDLPAGSLFVPIAQARARLLMGLLEPAAPDALLGWGAFNNAFEQKEYMEAYVAEEVAREMLAQDPALQAAFAQRLREDAAFAASPRARLEFFARRHASWDRRYGLYPVLRTDRAP